MTKTNSFFHLLSGFLSCFLCITFLSSAAAQDVIWRTTLDNDPAQRDTARSMVPLTNGDLVVGGQSGATATNNFIVYRLNGSTGAVMWTRTLSSGFGSDDVNDIIADPATGDTYICGRSGSASQQLNWYVMKINGSNGTNAWAAPYTFNQTNENDEPRALDFVQDGAVKNVVVVGSITNSGSPQGRIVKLNASTGALMWGTNVGPQLWAVVTDASGNIFCGGETFAVANQATITKFNISGTQQWQQTYAPNGGGFNRWNKIALDATSGDVITGGLILGPAGNNDIGTARYRSSDGAQLWSRMINGPFTNANDSCSSVTVDSGGDVYVTGFYRATSTSADWYAARLNIANGNTVWEKTYNGTVTGNEQLENLRVVGSTVYLAGYMRNNVASVAARTLRVMKLAKSDGSTLLETDFLDRVGAQVVGNKSLIVAANGDMIVSGDSGVTTNAAEIARLGSLSAVAPVVTNVTSSTANGSYRATQSVSIQVTFDASVTVVGTPTLALNSGGSASYSSGSPGTTLTFNYTIGAAQTAADLDYSATNSLSLAGGTINATTGGTAATLTLPAPGAAGSLGANKAIVIDTTPPTVTSIVRRLPSTAQATTSTSATFRVTFSEPVNTPATSNFAVVAVNASTITGTISSVTPVSTSIYDVAVTITSGTGEFRLKVVD